MSESTCWHCEKRPIADEETGMCRDCLSDMHHQNKVAELTPKAAEALETLHRLANDRAGTDAIKRALEREHRTNQQLVCRAIVAMLEKWAEDGKRGPGWYDLRNEASVRFAASVFEKVPERERYFPYI